jgi:hypothetical protein
MEIKLRIKLTIRALFVAGVTLWPLAALGADTFLTGNMLYDRCAASTISCSDYISGVVDTLLMVGKVKKLPLICPGNIELGQAVDVTVNYLRAHPESRQYNAASVAIVALTKAFPCNSH